MIPALPRANRDFRRLWAAASISLLGDQVSVIAMPLVAVLALDANARQMGYLGAAALAPNLLFALHAGAFVDRYGRRRVVMIFADVGRALLTATVPLAYAFDALTFGQLYAVAFLTGTLSVFFWVSSSTLFISVVPRESYVEGNQLMHGSRAASYMAGPSIGGVLVQALSAPVAVLVDAVSFLGSALFLGRVGAAEPPPEEERKGRIVAGARYIARSAIIRAGLGATATINFFNFIFAALFLLYATRSLDIEPGLLGVVLGAGAVGSLAGSVVTGRLVRLIGVGPAFMLGCFLFPAPLLLVPAAGGPRWLVLFMLFLAEFGSGVGVMILDIAAGSMTAGLVPDTLRARVSGAYMVVNYGVRPLGSLIGGALGSALGLRPTLWIATAGAIAGVLWLFPSPIPRLKAIPDQEVGTASA